MATLKKRFRSVYISDMHLGCTTSRADELRQFLKHVDCDTLYLVGDILDLWCLKRRWRWPETNNRIVNRLLKMVKNGTRVVLIPGNHDEALRQYDGLSFGGVEIRLEAVHVTADNKRVLITHGDEFDLVVRHAPLLSLIGGHAYDGLLLINRRYNRIRAWLGLEYWSLSQFLKLKVKSACKYISSFEDAVIAEGARRGVDAVICGHIHKAEDRPGPVRYLNCGDWVEGSDAVVEHDDGRLELINGAKLVRELQALEAVQAESDAKTELVGISFVDEEPEEELNARPALAGLWG